MRLDFVPIFLHKAHLFGVFGSPWGPRIVFALPRSSVLYACDGVPHLVQLSGGMVWVLLGWFGGSGPGLGGFGGPSGSGWGPGAVVFLALVRTRSGIHDFQSSFIWSSIGWQPFGIQNRP